jgi:hypothetical protein
MLRRNSSIFINAFLDLPQYVSASHCHHQGVVVCSVTAVTEPTVHAWLHPSTTDHSGRAVISMHPQHRLLE